MILDFSEGGTFCLYAVQEKDNYASFEITFNKPVSQEGLTVKAYPNVFEVPVGATSIEGFLRRGKWTAFSLNAEKAIKLDIKEVVLIDTVGNRSFVKSNHHGFPGRRFTWHSEDGIEHNVSISASHKDVNIVDIFSGNIALKKSDILGGKKWAARKTGNEPIIYQLNLNSPINASGQLVWKIQTAQGAIRYMPIGDGVSFSQVEIDDDVIDCSIVYQGENPERVVLNIESVTMLNGSTVTNIDKVPVSKELNERYNLFGQKLPKGKRGLSIVRGNNGRVVKIITK